MPDKGIIFSAPMVRALLDGRKTQTRRLLKLPKWAAQPPEFEEDERGVAAIVEETGCFALLPTALIGDRLYVREAWSCHWATDDQRPRDIDPTLWSVRYLADDHIQPAACDNGVALIDQFKRKRPARFMPRWASRLTLTVTDVRVQRVQEITTEDILAEGAPLDPNHVDGTQDGSNPYMCDIEGCAWTKQSPRAWYHRLWDSLHTAEGERWQDNPWIVAVTFAVARGNIDQIRSAAA